MNQMSTVVRHDGSKRSVSPENKIQAPSVALLGTIGTAEKLAKPRKEANSAEPDKEQ